VLTKEAELKAEEMRLEDVRRDLEKGARKVQQSVAAATAAGKVRLLVSSYMFSIDSDGSVSLKEKRLLEIVAMSSKSSPCPRNRRHGDLHFVRPPTEELHALRNERCRSNLDGRDTCHALTRRACQPVQTIPKGQIEFRQDR
jgi:hypothetical protein